MTSINLFYCCENVFTLMFTLALKKDEHYYPEVLLRESKYIEKEKKVNRHITDDLENSCDDSNESDEE